jgi:hypothetical protein
VFVTVFLCFDRQNSKIPKCGPILPLTQGLSRQSWLKLWIRLAGLLGHATCTSSLLIRLS